MWLEAYIWEFICIYVSINLILHFSMIRSSIVIIILTSFTGVSLFALDAFKTF